MHAAMRLVMVAALAVGGWFGYRFAVGLLNPGFPNQIDGVPRSLDAGAGGFDATMRRWSDALNLKLRSQIYSSAVQNNDDAFAVVEVTGWSGRFSVDGLLLEITNFGSPVKISSSGLHHEKVGGVRYTCVQDLGRATRCLWPSGTDQVTLVVGTAARSYDDVVRLAAAARAAFGTS